MLKNIINENKALKVVILISSLMLPVIVFGNMTGIVSIDYLNFIDTLWIGFYSCIFLILFIDSGFLNSFKVLLIVPNVISILFVMVFSLMGGLQGLAIVAIKMFLPFIPYEWVASFIFAIFGYPKP